MPFTIEEANRIFQRSVERRQAEISGEIEQGEALQMGAGICNALIKRNAQLEELLKKANIPLPGSPVPRDVGNVLPMNAPVPPAEGPVNP